MALLLLSFSTQPSCACNFSCTAMDEETSICYAPGKGFIMRQARGSRPTSPGNQHHKPPWHFALRSRSAPALTRPKQQQQRWDLDYTTQLNSHGCVEDIHQRLCSFCQTICQGSSQQDEMVEDVRRLSPPTSNALLTKTISIRYTVLRNSSCAPPS